MRSAGCRQTIADGHRRRRRRDPRRQAPRPVRRRRLPGRRRHVAQHERQRGARQPRRRDPRRARAATYTRVHPNDHVNMGQSTNDVFPTATRLAILADGAGRWSTRRAGSLTDSTRRAASSRSVLKTGRTHLQDAVPITLGQEFGGYAANVAHAAAELERTVDAAARAESRRHGGRHRAERRRRLHAACGVAISRRDTRRCRCGRRRIGSASRRAWATCWPIRARCAGWPSKSARSRRTCGFSAWGRAPASPRSSCRRCSRARRSCPARSIRRCRRWSTRSASRCIGCDATILAAADAGQLELNVMMPVIAWNALHATRILTKAMRVLQDALRRRHPGRRRALPRAARSQHRAGDRAQPVHRLRRNRRHRQDVGRDRPADPRAGARAAAAPRRRSSTRSSRPKR